ncbi:hypothetical protein O181_090389 [Austropuccinia psidii MF-1]|uniref:Helicase ATP-binding domain-containing protein n=1 Tax=Austropuccinia psidii MF-1 TaxID=1389203 RepID=A0A9Q3IVI1_9BASI|nr:hypothetical protein [Austropuccinia psidii MF-1]
MTKPNLAGYATMIIEELHERKLSTDILRGLVKDMAHLRRDFWLIISSATMNSAKFSVHFDDAPIFHIEILYTPNCYCPTCN